MEEATGLRQDTCPWWAIRDRFTQHVIGAYPWREKGDLRAKWPVVPAALIAGIEVYAAALGRVRDRDWREDLERDREERESKQPRGHRRR